MVSELEAGIGGMQEKERKKEEGRKEGRKERKKERKTERQRDREAKREREGEIRLDKPIKSGRIPQKDKRCDLRFVSWSHNTIKTGIIATGIASSTTVTESCP